MKAEQESNTDDNGNQCNKTQKQQRRKSSFLEDQYNWKTSSHKKNRRIKVPIIGIREVIS